MFQVKALFFRALLALSLIGAVPAALAGPTYQVTINGHADARSLDLQFLSNGSAEQAYAYITNLSGDFGAILDSANAVGSLATGFRIGNDTGFNGLWFELLSAGPISFDLRFSQGDLGDGTIFSAALLDAGNMEIGGDKLFTISLMPGVADALELVQPGVGVNAVPEPADWALVATGLLLIGALRRQQRH
jgi:hypothetical protein